MPFKRAPSPVSPPAASAAPAGGMRAAGASTGAPARRWFVPLVILLYLALAAAYNRLTPFVVGPQAALLIQTNRLPTNPDEAAHVANARVYRSGRLPVFHAGDPDFEAHQPPLYYLLVAPLLSADPADVQPARAARWLTIALGALTIVAAYGAARAAAPGEPAVAEGAAAFVALLPMNVSLCASISNDALANLVVALSLWQLARLVRGAGRWARARTAGESLLLAALLAAGLYTKTSTLSVFAAVLAAALLMARGGRGSGRALDAALMAVVSTGGALLLAAPWLARNTRLYGDPLAQRVFQGAFTQTTMTAQRMQALAHIGPLGYVGLVTRSTFDSFWGVFDSMQLFLPQGIYAALAVVTALACGGAYVLRRGSSAGDEAASGEQGGEAAAGAGAGGASGGGMAAQAIFAAALAALFAATLAAFALFNATFFQAQGRYLYPALLPVAYLFGVAAARWAARLGGADAARRAPALLAGGLLLLNAYSIHLIQATFS